MTYHMTIVSTSTLFLAIFCLFVGTFYFYSESSWIQASPDFRFDLLFSLQFGIAITLCLVLIFTENSYMPFGFVSRSLQVNRFLSLLIVYCFLYSVQQVISIILFGVGYGRTTPLKDRFVVYALLCLLALVTTGWSLVMVCLLSSSNELDVREICIRKKDYDEKSVRARLTRVLKNVIDDPLQVGQEFSDSFPAFRIGLNPDVVRRLALFFLSKSCTIARVSATHELAELKPGLEAPCFVCDGVLEDNEGFARVCHRAYLQRAHWYCLERWRIYPGTGRCEISDAISEMRNMGGIVTAEERDSLVKALSD